MQLKETLRKALLPPYVDEPKIGRKEMNKFFSSANPFGDQV